MVADVGHVQVAPIVQRDAMRLAKQGLASRPAVAGKASARVARHGRDEPRVQIDAAHEVVLHLDEVQIMPGSVEAHLVRFVELRLGGRAAVTGVAGRAIASHAGKLAALTIQSQHAVLPH